MDNILFYITLSCMSVGSKDTSFKTILNQRSCFCGAIKDIDHTKEANIRQAKESCGFIKKEEDK